MIAMDGLTRGALAQAAGVNPETIRYYERIGLLPKPRRAPSGYRLYSGDTVRRLGFIKQAQALGFSLAEIASLLLLQFDAQLSCAHLARQARKKSAEIESKIATLIALRDGLLALAGQCEQAGCACDSGCTALLANPPRGRAEIPATTGGQAWGNPAGSR
jgi:DNA-binding transcriptional MerR regulator